MRLVDRIKAKITRRSVTTDPSVIALSKFQETILTWDREQARIALAILAALGHGDQGPIQSIFGAGAKVETAIRHLTVGHIRVLVSTMQEIFPETFNGFDPNAEEEDGDD